MNQYHIFVIYEKKLDMLMERANMYDTRTHAQSMFDIVKMQINRMCGWAAHVHNTWSYQDAKAYQRREG